MVGLFLTLLLTAAGATSASNTAAGCGPATDSRAASTVGRCADRNTSSTSPPIKDAAAARSDAASNRDDSAREPADDEPWTYETGPDDLERVCITRGAGGICLDSDD